MENPSRQHYCKLLPLVQVDLLSAKRFPIQVMSHLFMIDFIRPHDSFYSNLLLYVFMRNEGIILELNVSQKKY